MADNDKTPEDKAADAADNKGDAGTDRRRSRSVRGRGANKPDAPDPSKLNFFRIVPEDTRIEFVKNRRKGLIFSLILILIALGTMVGRVANGQDALNYGIDFKGGSSVRIALTQTADIEQMRTVLDEAGYVGSSAVAVPDHDNEVLIRVKEVIAITEAELETCKGALDQLPEGTRLAEGDDGFLHPGAESSKIFMKFTAQPNYADINRLMSEAGCEGTASAGQGKPEEFPVEFALIGVGNDIANAINTALGEGTVDHIVASESVGAKVGSQLKRDGVQAMVIAIFLIFLFVMIRFDLRFAPGGIVALTHDAIIVVGAFAITGKEFNLQTIAALLTIIGYSINDTIVVFDRIRERVALHRDDPIEETTNTALNETLSRTVLTSVTTMIVVLATYLLGSGAIKDFAFALIIGLIVGTYSSLAVASPVFLWVNDKMYKGKGHLITADKDAQRGTGTLLGPQIEQGQDGGGAEAAPASAAGGVVSAADAQTVGEGGEGGSALDGVKISDVDKNVGERKTRRRRRRPQG